MYKNQYCLAELRFPLSFHGIKTANIVYDDPMTISLMSQEQIELSKCVAATNSLMLAWISQCQVAFVALCIHAHSRVTFEPT